MTKVATLPTWPKPSTPFKIKFKVKITGPITATQRIISFVDNNFPQRRLPAIYFSQNGQIMSFHRCQDGKDYNAIGAWSDITSGNYHQIKLAQEQETNGSFKIKFYINGVVKGSKIVAIPNTVYSNIDVMVAEAVNGVNYVIKDLDYGDL